MASVTWDDVVRKCLNDSAFFEALVKNPSGTLGQNDMALSAADLKKLEAQVKDQTMMNDFRAFMKLWVKLHNATRGFGPTW